MKHSELIYTLENYIKPSEYFSKLLSDITILTVDKLIEFIKSGMMDGNKICELERIVPTCYNIGGKVFLQGETKGSFDLVGDGLGEQPLTELFDMTTEMITGDSYSFYVSDLSYFEKASVKEAEDVKKFLLSLK